MNLLPGDIQRLRPRRHWAYLKSEATKVLALCSLSVDQLRQQADDVSRAAYGILVTERQSLSRDIDGSTIMQSRARLGGSLQEFEADLLNLDELTNALSVAVRTLEHLQGQVERGRAIAQVVPGAHDAVSATIRAQEEERARLSREIHDGPAQTLTNMSMQLDFISKLAKVEPARVQGEIEELQKDLRMAISDMRRFMYDLRPPALAQNGLRAAVETHAQRLTQRFGLPITVRMPSETGLSGAEEVVVFRIIQESLQNTLKHGKANHVLIEGLRSEQTYTVTVADDGVGFALEALDHVGPEHFGVSGMRSRAQLIGADLLIDSGLNQGTRVTLTALVHLTEV